MAFLFEISEKVVFPNPETLLIPPFKEIWERDKDKAKHTALEEFAYIEFMSSMKKSNPYAQYAENKKEQIIKEDIITDENWSPDLLVNQGITKLKSLQEDGSVTYSYYMSAKRAAEKMKDFFINVNINERNEKSGMPIYKPSDITRALNDTSKVLQNINDLKEKVEQELFESSKMRSNKKISPFANPDSL